LLSKYFIHSTGNDIFSEYSGVCFLSSRHKAFHFFQLSACRRQCLTWLSEATCNICAPHEHARSLFNAVLLLCYCFREHSSRITSTYCRRFKSNPQYLFLLLSAFASAFELSSVLLASRSQKNRYLLKLSFGKQFFPLLNDVTVPSVITLQKYSY